MKHIEDLIKAVKNHHIDLDHPMFDTRGAFIPDDKYVDCMRACNEVLMVKIKPYGKARKEPVVREKDVSPSGLDRGVVDADILRAKKQAFLKGVK